MASFSDTIKDNFNSLPTWGRVVVGIAAVGGSTYFLFQIAKKIKGPRKSPYKTDYKPGVVYVYQFQRTAAIPSFSPFALKLETWLRMANVAYENVETPFWLRSKEGMLPFVELNGVEYDDSTFIIRDLTKIFKKESMDASLSTEQKAISRAYEQMIDASTFVSFAYIRYTEHMETMLTEKFMGVKIPLMFRLLYPPWYMKRQAKERLRAHGIGRHPREEIIGIGLDDLRSISTYLGSKQYFHGETPTRVDAFLFGYLAQIIYVLLDSPHQKLMNTECRNLARYCDRIKAKYWPDWDDICKTRALNTWKK